MRGSSSGPCRASTTAHPASSCFAGADLRGRPRRARRARVQSRWSQVRGGVAEHETDRGLVLVVRNPISPGQVRVCGSSGHVDGGRRTWHCLPRRRRCMSDPDGTMKLDKPTGFRRRPRQRCGHSLARSTSELSGVRGAIVALEDDFRLRRALSVVPDVDFYATR